MSNEKTNVAEFVSELQAGVFEQQIATAINSVAGATVEHVRRRQVIRSAQPAWASDPQRSRN